MSKIIKLDKDASYYYERALDKSDNDDFIGCLKLLRQAERLIQRPDSDEDLAVQLEIADTLGLMGLYSESNRIYFRMTAFDYCLSDVYYGIIKNYALSDMHEEAAYYLNYAIENGYLSGDDMLDAIEYETSGKASGSHLRLVRSNDNSQTLRLAKQLLASADTEFARQMLETVPENSEQFIEAANYRALIAVGEGKIEDGLELCEKVLQKDECDVYALTTKILGLSMDGRTKACEEAIAGLEGLNITTWPAIARIALCYCQIGDARRAFERLTLCIDRVPYDRDLLLLYALCASNIGKHREAKNALVQLQLINPEDSVVRYYAREVDLAFGEPTNFELIPDLPAEVCERYAKRIESEIELVKDADLFWEAVKSDGELYDMVRWGLYCDNTAFAVRVGKVLACAESAYGLLRKVLVDPDYPIIPKKEIFSGLLKERKMRMIQTVVGSEIRWYRPSIPKEIKGKVFTGAYWQVYAALAFIASEFDRKLAASFKKLYELFRSAGFLTGLKENVVAAVLAYKSRINKIFSSKQAVCEVFGCKTEELTQYLQKIEPATEKSNKRRKKEDAT